jgi:hypothetical protein
MGEKLDKQEIYARQGEWLALIGLLMFIGGIFLGLFILTGPGFILMGAGAIIHLTNARKKEIE